MPRLLPILLLPCLLLGACQYKDPSLTLGDVAVTQTTGEAMRLDFALSLDNPNDVPLQLLTFDYALSIDDQWVYYGKRAAGATLNRKATRGLSIPAVIPYDLAGWEDGPPTSARYYLSGTISYLTPGRVAELFFDMRLYRPKARFGYSGQLTLGVTTPEEPAAAAPPPDADGPG